MFKFRVTNTELLLLTGLTGTLTLLGYYFLIGKYNNNERVSLINRLNNAKHDVRELEEQLNSLELENVNNDNDTNNKNKNMDTNLSEKKQIRIFVDGAFDLFHYGHMNAFRQARALGTFLIVGVNSDDSITICKGGK